jgi:hypothetical protein
MRFLVEWNQRTLDQMHLTYKRRCERDSLNVGDMWLGEADLERDTGELVAIEQPTEIVTRPLLPNVAEDRIRAVFGLTSDDPIPAVNAVTLRQYHRFLADRLSFPFTAEFNKIGEDPFDGTEYRVQVVALLDAEEGDEDNGLLCQVHNESEDADVALALMRVKGSSNNRQLVADYSLWFFEESLEHAAGGSADWQSLATSLSRLRRSRAYWHMLIMFCIAGMVYGSTLGAILGTVDTGVAAVTVGGVLLAFVASVVGYRLGLQRDPEDSAWLGPLPSMLLHAIVGAVIGAAVGAAAALLIAEYVGALIGGLLVTLIVGVRVHADTALARTLLGTTVGAVAGSLLLAVWRDSASAGVGALYGAGGGTAGAMLLFLMIDGWFRGSVRRNGPTDS